MKKIGEKVIGFFRLIHLHTILLILLLYLMLCYACYINLRIDGVNIAFVDVVVFNLLAVAGNDYMFTDSPWTRVTGLFVLGLGMVGFSAITGYISSAYVASRLSQERGIKKMQNMKNHIIICGWKFEEAGIYTSGMIFWMLDLDQMQEKTVIELDEYVRDRKNLRRVVSTAFRCFHVK